MTSAGSDSRQLLSFLRALRWRRIAVEVATSSVIAASAAAGLGFLLLAAEATLYLSPPWRTALGGGVIVGGFLTFCALLRSRLNGRLTLRATALDAEHRYPPFQQRLISTLELQGSRGRMYSADLLAATADAVNALIAGIELWRIVDTGLLRRAMRRALLGCAVLVIVATPFREALSGAADRCVHPRTAYAREIRTGITLSPGNVEIVEGDDLLVEMRFTGDIPRTAHISRRDTGATTWDTEEFLVTSGLDSLSHRFTSVRRPFEYHVSAGDGESERYQVSVIQPPAVQRMRLSYTYPEYSSLPPRVDEEGGGDIDGLAGTEVQLEIIATKPLAAAVVVIDDSLRLVATAQDATAALTLRLAKSALSVETPIGGVTAVADGHYFVVLTDHKGVSNDDPIRHAIEVDLDARPGVDILVPGEDGDLPDRQMLELHIEARDDFGISALDLVYQIANRPPQRQSLPIRATVRDAGASDHIRVTYLWDLTEAGLLPEDRIRYHVDAFDNNTLSGPSMTSSREYVLRVPSLYEVFEEISSHQEENIHALEQLAEEETVARHQLEEMRRELVKKSELNWQKEQELDTALTKQAERAEAVEELARQIADTVEKLEEHGLSSQSVLDKLQEIRELMEEVTSPQLRQALEELQQDVESLEPMELAEALREFAKDREVFHERLDRTIELLRRIHAEQRLDAALRRAEDLLARQKQIDANLKQSPNNTAELAAQQSSERRDTERLREELESLAEEVGDMSPSTSEALAGEASAMKQKQLSGRMKEMEDHLRAARPTQAERLGAGIEEDLGSLSSGLESARSKFVAEQKKQIGADMKRVIAGLLELSFRQEELATETRESTSARIPVDVAHEQFALAQGTGMVIERVARISEKTMTIEHGLPATLGGALEVMEQAARHLGQSESLAAADRQFEAMGYLNEAILMLRQSAENLGRSDMPSGFAESMQKMLGLSEQQAGLNEATQDLLSQGREMGERGRGTPDLREQMRRLLEQQRRIYEALVRQERELRGNRGAQKRVEAIRKEMKNLLGEMERGRLSPRITQSQDRILQRMLDASRSIYSRGFKRERQSKSGEDALYSGPGSLPADLGQARDFLREAMKRALDGDYPADYLALIRRYYELVYGDAVGVNADPEELP